MNGCRAGLPDEEQDSLGIVSPATISPQMLSSLRPLVNCVPCADLQSLQPIFKALAGA